MQFIAVALVLVLPLWAFGQRRPVADCRGTQALEILESVAAKVGCNLGNRISGCTGIGQAVQSGVFVPPFFTPAAAAKSEGGVLEARRGSIAGKISQLRDHALQRISGQAIETKAASEAAGSASSAARKFAVEQGGAALSAVLASSEWKSKVAPLEQSFATALRELESVERLANTKISSRDPGVLKKLEKAAELAEKLDKARAQALSSLLEKVFQSGAIAESLAKMQAADRAGAEKLLRATVQTRAAEVTVGSWRKAMSSADDLARKFGSRDPRAASLAGYGKAARIGKGALKVGAVVAGLGLELLAQEAVFYAAEAGYAAATGCTDEKRNHRYVCRSTMTCNDSYTLCPEVEHFLNLSQSRQVEVMEKDPEVCSYYRELDKRMTMPPVKAVASCEGENLRLEADISAVKPYGRTYVVKRSTPRKVSVYSGHSDGAKDLSHVWSFDQDDKIAKMETSVDGRLQPVYVAPSQGGSIDGESPWPSLRLELPNSGEGADDSRGAMIVARDYQVLKRWAPAALACCERENNAECLREFNSVGGKDAGPAAAPHRNQNVR